MLGYAKWDPLPPQLKVPEATHDPLVTIASGVRMPAELLNLFRIEFIATDHLFKYFGGLTLRRASPKLLTFIRVCWMVVEYGMITQVRCCVPNTKGVVV